MGGFVLHSDRSGIWFYPMYKLLRHLVTGSWTLIWLEIPGSETKDFITHSTMGSTSLAVFASVPLCFPMTSRGLHKPAHLVGCLMREGNWVGWPGVLEHEVSKPVLCPGESYYLTLKVSRCKHNPEKWPGISQDLRLLAHPLYWVEWWPPPSKIYPNPQICECYLTYTEEGLWRLPCESVGRNLNGETTSGEGSEVSKSY